MCNSAVVKQVHLESAGGREDVVLGVWDVEAHKEWFRRAGKKKMTKRFTHTHTHKCLFVYEC